MRKFRRYRVRHRPLHPGWTWNQHPKSSFRAAIQVWSSLHTIGTLFNAMVHRAFALQPRLALRGLGASARLVVGLLVNADVHLPRNLPQIFAKLLALSPEFFAVAARWDVDVLHPGNSREAFAQEHGTLHSYGGIDLFAWSLRSYQDLLDSDASSSGNRSVIGVRIPSFVFGRGKYDNWLFHEILQTRRWNLTVEDRKSVV